MSPRSIRALATIKSCCDNVIEENNTLFEQTEKRKEFVKKNKEFIQKQIRKNETTDYYENFSK